MPLNKETKPNREPQEDADTKMQQIKIIRNIKKCSEVLTELTVTWFSMIATRSYKYQNMK